MVTGKKILVLFLCIITASVFSTYFFFLRPRLAQKKLANPQCPRELVITIDPEELTYTSDSIKKVVGTINLDPKIVKGIMYDLIGYAGGVGYGTSFWNTSYDNRKNWDTEDKKWTDHAGWKKINLNPQKEPVTFNFEPKLPDKINKFGLIDISIAAICKDGSMTHETVVGFLRHPFPNLYFVNSSNPIKIKYFK